MMPLFDRILEYPIISLSTMNPSIRVQKIRPMGLQTQVLIIVQGEGEQRHSFQLQVVEEGEVVQILQEAVAEGLR